MAHAYMDDDQYNAEWAAMCQSCIDSGYLVAPDTPPDG